MNTGQCNEQKEGALNSLIRKNKIYNFICFGLLAVINYNKI